MFFPNEGGISGTVRPFPIFLGFLFYSPQAKNREKTFEKLWMGSEGFFEWKDASMCFAGFLFSSSLFLLLHDFYP